MNCKNRLFKMFAAFLLASAAVSFSMQGMDSAVTNPEMQKTFTFLLILKMKLLLQAKFTVSQK